MRRFQVTTVLAAAALASAAGLADAAPVPTHQLNVNIAGTGSGVINGSSIDCHASSGGPVGPCTIRELSGNRVTLTARASKGSVFAGWSGGGCSGTGSCTVTLNRNITVTAKFNMAVLSVINRPLRVSSSQHTALVLVHCRGPGACNGSLELSTVVKGKSTRLASVNYNVAQGASPDLVLRFSSRAIRLIARNHNTLKAELTVLPNDGQPLFAKRTLKLS